MPASCEIKLQSLENKKLISEKLPSTIPPAHRQLIEGYFGLVEWDTIREIGPDEAPFVIEQTVLMLKDLAGIGVQENGNGDQFRKSPKKDIIRIQIKNLTSDDFLKDPNWKKNIFRIFRYQIVDLLQVDGITLSDAMTTDERYPNHLRQLSPIDQIKLMENIIRKPKKI
jgi:hypothetical protein